MVCASPASPDPDHRQAFDAMIPRITRIAKISFRHLKPEAREEAVQEVLCNAWQAYNRLVERGKADVAYPSVLARYASNKCAITERSAANSMSKMFSVLTVRPGRTSSSNASISATLMASGSRQSSRTRLPAPPTSPRRASTSATISAASPRASAGLLGSWPRASPRHRRSKRFDLSAGRISQIRTELKQAWDRFRRQRRPRCQRGLILSSSGWHHATPLRPSPGSFISSERRGRVLFDSPPHGGSYRSSSHFIRNHKDQNHDHHRPVRHAPFSPFLSSPGSFASGLPSISQQGDHDDATLVAPVALLLVLAILPDLVFCLQPYLLCHTLFESSSLSPRPPWSASAASSKTPSPPSLPSSTGKAKTAATKTRPPCRPRPLHNDPKETRCETSFWRPSF